MRSLSLSGLGRSMFFALGAIGITAAAVFAAGSLVLPDQGPDPWQQGTASPPTVNDVNGSQALLMLSGDDTGRYELDQLAVGEWNQGGSPEEALRLLLTFRGDNVSMVISAREISGGTPAVGAAASVSISMPGASYFANDGECTITLADVSYQVLEPQPAVLDGVPRGVPIPTYAGTVECVGVEELRTDRHIDVHAAFRHQPED